MSYFHDYIATGNGGTNTGEVVGGNLYDVDIVTIEGQSDIVVPDGYNANNIIVSYNGRKLPAEDFTAEDGIIIILGFGATAGATVNVLSFTPIGIANTYSEVEVDALLDQLESKMNNAIAAGSTGNYISINANHNAVNRNYLLVDSTSGPISVILPTIPKPFDKITISDLKGNFHVNNLTVKGSGKTIMGSSEDLTLISKNITVTLLYVSGDWRVV